MSVFFSRFMGNESQCGTNKSHENRERSANKIKHTNLKGI